MNQLNQVIILILNIINLSVYVNTFNISPKPNLIFREPDLKFVLPKIRSSYFGYSINLRTSSLIVGAPRAQSNEELQGNVNETGAIYKCLLVNGKCSPYIFDKYGNKKSENNEYAWNSEKKDFQWLGATIDGGSKDNETLIVCAPRTCTDTVDDYLMHGICYWVAETISDQPQNIKTISSLRLKSLQSLGNGIFNHMFGELGLSLHWSDVNEEILIGAPGIHTWKGSIVRYRVSEYNTSVSSKSRRDTMGKRYSRQNAKEYISDVLSPELWNQSNDSYFGYSVTSGKFDNTTKSKLSYVASAPQANNQSGEVYMFDIQIVETFYYLQNVLQKIVHYTIGKNKTFHGDQFGEYFGYLILSEDINKDSLADLLVSAPLYSLDTSYDNGAVYLFMNRGNFTFDKQIIISPNNEPSRFGSTMTKLGDINQDGFNDIAIGAPFDKTGSVFIYLGGPNGLREKPSQVLHFSELNKYKKQQMFGYGLSRGVDIDFNGFNDFAIGAPGLESVYLYKSYPVVKILTSISLINDRIQMNQTQLQVLVCFSIETNSTNITSQEITSIIKADQKLKRITFDDGRNELSVISTATTTEECEIYDVKVKFILEEIFKPIEVEIYYKLTNKIPDNETFCNTCAVVDPMDATVTKQKIYFSTGCKNDVCVADLKLTSSKIQPIFIFGSSRTMTIEFNIINRGEVAYLPQLNITSSNHMPFAKIPSNCVEKGMVLLCDLFQGQPLPTGNQDNISFMFDTSNVYGTHMMILAEVFSTSKQKDRSNSFLNRTILLKEYSSVEVIASTTRPIIFLEEQKGFDDISNNYEIKNIGPTTIKEIDIILMIPTSYNRHDKGIRVPLITLNDITVQAEYASNSLIVDYYQNYSLTKPFIENQATSIDSSDQTTLFNCIDSEEALCIQAIIKIHNFRADENELISLILKFKINLDEIRKILTDNKEFFVITTGINLNKIGDKKGETMKIYKNIPRNVISKRSYSFPFWVIIMAVLAGILVLALLSYGLYKLGFFKRTTKLEIANLTKNKMIQNKLDDSDNDDF